MGKSPVENSFGFTLVELMAAIAIVGILAAIAIPNYNKYQRKARQAEGKLMLGSGYIAEATLKQADNGGSYSACTRAIMVNLEGLQLYSVGFNNDAGNSNLCTPQGQPAALGAVGTQISGCNAYSWRKDLTGGFAIAAVCPPAQYSLITTNRATPSSAAPAVASDLGGQVAWDSFEMIAAGSIGGSLLDKWGINEAKSIYQLQDGVAGN
jgi:prepilin-type N-terminal cleavage/methylation domain-containing protein